MYRRRRRPTSRGGAARGMRPSRKERWATPPSAGCAPASSRNSTDHVSIPSETTAGSALVRIPVNSGTSRVAPPANTSETGAVTESVRPAGSLESREQAMNVPLRRSCSMIKSHSRVRFQQSLKSLPSMSTCRVASMSVTSSASCHKGTPNTRSFPCWTRWWSRCPFTPSPQIVARSVRRGRFANGRRCSSPFSPRVSTVSNA